MYVPGRFDQNAAASVLLLNSPNQGRVVSAHVAEQDRSAIAGLHDYDA